MCPTSSWNVLIDSSESDVEQLLWSVDSTPLLEAQKRLPQRNVKLIENLVRTMSGESPERKQIQFNKHFPEADGFDLTRLGNNSYIMIDAYDEKLPALSSNLNHCDAVISVFHDGKHSFCFRDDAENNSFDVCSKSFFSSGVANASVEETFDVTDIVETTNRLFSTVINNTLRLDDGSTNMSLNVDLVANFLVNPFSQDVKNSTTQSETIDTQSAYIPRNASFYVETLDGLMEGKDAMDNVHNYAGAQLTKPILSRSERTIETNAQYMDLYKSLRGWLTDDSLVVSLIARELATWPDFSQCPRLGVHLIALRHYI